MELGLMTIILLVFGVYLVFASVKTVPQSQNWLVEQFGRYTKTLDPGLHFLMPFVERVSYRFSLQEIVLDVPSQQVITKDNTQVTADGVV